LLGIFIGLVLGLAIAAAVAYYLGKSGLTTPLPAGGQSKDLTRSGKSDTTVTGAASEKPRFDFYKILPGGEEPKASSVERRAIEKAPERPAERASQDVVAKAEPAATRPGDRLWLQAGAFANASEAENLKARLALSGWEAVIQTATLPDKSVRYRVRIGPYDNNDQLNRTKADLGKSGFDAAVIRNP
jgi:cell division protein FtsN